MLSILVQEFCDKAKVYHLDFSIVDSEIVRLQISVHDLCILMQGLDSIEHLKQDVDNTDFVFSIYSIFNMFIYTLLEVFHLYCLAFIKKCATIILRYIIIKTNNLRELLEYIILFHDLSTRFYL